MNKNKSKDEDKIETLEIKLRHLSNQYKVVTQQYEKTTEEYIKILDEISKANKKLQNEIAERKKTGEALKNSEIKLQDQKSALEQKNIALREIVAQIEIEKNKIKEDIITNLEKIIFPILGKIKLRDNSNEYIDFLKKALEKLTSSFGREITKKYYNLTTREIEICTMVENGFMNKEISKMFYISYRTVENHRKRIRKKFDIINKNINLSTFLKQLH